MATRGLTAGICRLALCRSSAGRQFCKLACASTSSARHYAIYHDATTTSVHNHNLQSRTFLKKALYSTSHYDKWTDLTYEDLVALLDSGDIQLFDVREQREIEETGSIPRSVNIPLGGIKEALQMEEARFSEFYKVPKPDVHDTNVVFYGLGPIKSSAALEIAHKIGYKKARHYVGGYEEWVTKQKQSK